MSITYRITEQGMAEANAILDEWLGTDRELADIAADYGMTEGHVRTLMWIVASGGSVEVDENNE